MVCTLLLLLTLLCALIGRDEEPLLLIEFGLEELLVAEEDD
ncbi:hypothetical protein SAMN04488116_0771 [Flagellimonas flava]|uniref:Uncharacterized protein n=1 Tax=Flagellimonas flava TaxID=570519 RepID=A0A1M5IKP7_9FLAO|nr:hypothetical protein SAMN04488116_0771 [Allomuricauda flava]